LVREKPQRMVLTLPPDPALAGLAQLATLHFFRNNGAATLVARRCARAVQARARVLLRAGARRAGRGGAALALVLTSGTHSLKAVLRPGAGATRSLVVCSGRRGPD
jgi:hypothetical protein